MPVIAGSITDNVATAATAASAALPPARRMSTAARLAKGCAVAAMPPPAITVERPGSAKSRVMGIACRCVSAFNRPMTSCETTPSVLLGAVGIDRDVALRGPDGDREAGDHIDEAQHRHDQ